MALLKCPECNSDVSEYANTCPNCGCPIDIIKSKQPISKIEGHLYSLINGEEKDVTYFVEKILDNSYKYDLFDFKCKIWKELDIDMFDFINAVKECKGAPEEFNGEKKSEYFARVKQIQASLPKCPTCHSTNIKKIGTGERVASVVGLGILSKKINKTWKCCNCGYTW